MNAHLQRATLLYDQNRYEQAETELRQALSATPEDPLAHALLALCLCHRKEFAAATEEAKQAVHFGPDWRYTHFALGWVLHDRNHLKEALEAADESVRLEPDNADSHALRSQILMGMRKWAEALGAAENGLEFDPEHVACNNLRAMALVKLGRKSEAGQTIDSTLRRAPEDAITHANKGWTCLEEGNPQQALAHFGEALRLEPNNEWARQGTVEALKARNIIYGVMLKYFLWMSKLQPNVQWGLIIGGYFANRALAALSRSQPELAPWLLPLRVLYFAFVFLSWTANPLFNLMLRLNRFGRLVLSREETVASNWVGGLLFAALISLALCFVNGFTSPFIVPAIVCGALVIPVSAIFSCQQGWPRKAMTLYTVALGLVGLALLAVAGMALLNSGNVSGGLKGPVGTLLVVFMFGVFGSGWVANALIMSRPRR
jgi:tetratricopeptide (TPR) repeat protein